ncbi:MAG: helix-turn-helix transcriptional regulator [Rhodoferax sp.]|nr:helix-turn-helix transcriptional regulator [Rhodoferax sp.]
MSKSSIALLSKYSHLLLTIYQLAQELAVSEFQDAILSALKGSLPFDSAVWGTGTMTPVGIDQHSTHLHHAGEAMVLAYNKVKHQDTAAALVAQQQTTTLAFKADVDLGGPDQLEILAYCREYGHLNYLITSDVHPITKFTHWISLYRTDPVQICTAEETQLFASLAPHLMQALAINRIIHLDKLSGDKARERWCVAIADTRGRIYHANAPFWKLLGSDWQVDGTDTLPKALLETLVMDDQVMGRNVIVQRSLENDLLYIKARQRQPVDHLSTREFLVARLLAEGLTQKEVASKLGRSQETIRSQLREIFRKLGINNVVLLAQHLALRA